MTPDFDPIELNRIPGEEQAVMRATREERAAIAERLDLLGLDRLEARLSLARDGDRVIAKGQLQASVTQACVVTGEPVRAEVREPFDLRFLPDTEAQREEEVEIAAEDCDVIFHDGQTIALGDSIADTLALALDPYPRSAGAAETLKQAGVLSESEAGPFAALAKLKSLKSEDGA